MSIGDHETLPPPAEEPKKTAKERRDEGIEIDGEWKPYNRAERGAATLESALERGREMKKGLMDKVGPFLESLRSRAASIASKGWKMLSSLVGFGAETIEDTVDNVRYAGKVIKSVPAGFGGMVGHVYGEARETVENLHDMVRPREAPDAERMTEIDLRRMEIDRTVHAMPEGAERTALADEYLALGEELEALQKGGERNLRGKKTIIRGAKMAGKGLAYGAAGVAAAATSPVWAPAAAAGYVGFKGMQKTAEVVGGAYDRAEAHIAEKEPNYLEVGEIVGDALSRIFGKEIHLTREQAIAVGVALEGTGIAQDFMKEGLETAEELLNAARGPAGMVAEMYKFMANPEMRQLLADTLKDAGIDLSDAIEAKAREIGAAAIQKGKTAAKWTGGATAAGVGAYAAGTAALAAGPAIASAAVAAAPVVAGVAAVGAAGYGTYRGAKAAKAYAGQKIDQGMAYVSQEWKKVEPDVQRAIDAHIAMGREEWKKTETALVNGIVSRVEAVLQFEENVRNIPKDLDRELTKQAEALQAGVRRAEAELNKFGTEAAEAVDAAMSRVGHVLGIAQRAYNEARLALVTPDVVASNPKTAEDVRTAASALDAINNEASASEVPRRLAPVNRPRTAVSGS